MGFQLLAAETKRFVGLTLEKHWGIKPQQVAPLPGGLIKPSYLISWGDQQAIFSEYQEVPDISQAILLRNQYLTNYYQANNVIDTESIPLLDGSEFLQLDKQYWLRPFIFGEVVSQLNPQLAKQLGQQVRLVHQLDYPPQATSWQQRTFTAKIIREIHQYAPDIHDLKPELLRILDAYEPSLTAARNRKVCLVHGDLHENNYLLHNSQLLLIDWGCARIDCPEYDLALVFVHLLARYSPQTALQLFSEFLTGHGSKLNQTTLDLILYINAFISWRIYWRFHHYSPVADKTEVYLDFWKNHPWLVANIETKQTVFESLLLD